MYKVNLSPTEQLELTKLEKQYQSDRKILRRLKCIHLRNEWLLPWKIADKLDISHDSVTDRMKLFINGWFDWLLDLHYEWRRVSEFEQYEAEIKQMIHDKIYSSYKELHDAISKKYNITKKQDALRKFCKKIWIWVTKNAI